MLGWFKRKKSEPEQTKPEPAAAEPAPPGGIPPAYWLEVCQGRDAALAYIRSSGDAVIEALQQYPILVHPQFPDAMVALGRSQGDQQLAAACTQSAAALRTTQQTLREELTQAYAAMNGMLGMRLAQEQGGDRRRNLEQAIERFRASAAAFGSGPGQAENLFNEANVWWTLADVGGEPRASMERAVQCYGEARAVFAEGPQAAECAFSEAKARVSLAERGFDPAPNLESAVRLYSEAYQGFGEGPKATACIMGEARARRMLGELTPQPGADGESK